MVGANKSPGGADGPLAGTFGAGVEGPLAGMVGGDKASPVGIVVCKSAEACGCICPQDPQNVWPGWSGALQNTHDCIQSLPCLVAVYFDERATNVSSAIIVALLLRSKGTGKNRTIL